MKTFANYLLRNKWILRLVMRFLSVEKQERIIIAKFREELAFWGYDISDMTDEQIKEAIVKVGEVISKLGFTTEEITGVMMAMAGKGLCEHPFAFVISKGNGEINKCLKCGKNL